MLFFLRISLNLVWEMAFALEKDDILGIVLSPYFYFPGFILFI